jgi:Fe/S biogenesis protein NfuA
MGRGPGEADRAGTLWVLEGTTASGGWHPWRLRDDMLTFTDRAREMVRAFMTQGEEGDLEALRIGVEGSPVAPRFELTLVSRADRREDEREVDVGDFAVLVSEDSLDRLDGATVDFVEKVNESGFEVRTQGGARPAPAPPSGPLAQRVREVLDSQVNPSIASHGGKIDLVDVKDTEIYLEMSGGCQGCAMSRMTLRQGVERMLRQSVPEITAVHDITDHASGANPYFNGEA